MSINNRLINAGGFVPLPCPDFTYTTYSGNLFNTRLFSLEIYADGTKGITTNSSGATANFTFGTPWDASTITLGSFSNLPSTSGVSSPVVSSDGTKILSYRVLSGSATRIYGHTLSTAWDVTTATYNGLFDISNFVYSFDVSSDGTKAFAGFPSGSPAVSQINFSTPWDITTASLDQTVTIPSSVGTLYSMQISEDGSKFFWGDAGGSISEYVFGTNLDISTLTYTGKTYYNNGPAFDSNVYLFKLTKDESKLYWGDGTGPVQEYDLNCVIQ